MTHYPAFIHKDADSCYGFSFPDFPGRISAGDTYDDAYSQAIDVLRAHVDLMRGDGDPVPDPSSLEDIMSAPDLVDQREGAAIIMVPLLALSGKDRRVNISLDETVLSVIDELAATAGATRSGFISSVAEVAARDKWEFYTDNKGGHRWRRSSSVSNTQAHVDSSGKRTANRDVDTGNVA